MAKRPRRPQPAPPAREEAARPSSPLERHSGEGAASALEILQKLEERRVEARPADARADDEPASRQD